MTDNLELDTPRASAANGERCALAPASERVVNVGDIPRAHRHAIIFQLFDRLAPGEGLQLVVDHDPRPLRYQFDVRHGARCTWSYLEQGPDVWRVRLRRDAG